jgi:putative MATE family efflux protein
MAKKDLTEGPVWRALAAMSAPMTLGILAVLSVGIVDAYFLGQLGGAPLAAVGYIYPVTAAITSLAIGLSAGANAVVSQAIGKKTSPRDVHRLGFHALGMGLGLSLLVAAAFAMGFTPLFALMGASQAVQTEIAAYVPIWSASFPFLVLMMITNALFRAHGNAALASIFMILAAALNIVLNPLLIFGFGGIDGMGTAGAAIATFAGRLMAAGAALFVAVRLGYLEWCRDVLADFRDSARRIVSVGGPAAFSNAINPAGMALVTAAVATLGDAAVAGFGAATRVQSVAIVVLLALSAGIGPVVGQNWGAGRPERAQAAVIQSWAFSIGYGFAIALGLSLFADPIAQLIAAGGDAVAYIADYLRIVGWSLFGYGILVTANSAMNARSKALYSMSLSLGRIFAVYLPCAWLGVRVAGYDGILAATVLANLTAVAGAVYFCRRAGLTPRRDTLTGAIVA